MRCCCCCVARCRLSLVGVGSVSLLLFVARRALSIGCCVLRMWYFLCVVVCCPLYVIICCV